MHAFNKRSPSLSFLVGASGPTDRRHRSVCGRMRGQVRQRGRAVGGRVPEGGPGRGHPRDLR